MVVGIRVVPLKKSGKERYSHGLSHHVLTPEPYPFSDSINVLMSEVERSVVERDRFLLGTFYFSLKENKSIEIHERIHHY